VIDLHDSAPDPPDDLLELAELHRRIRSRRDQRRAGLAVAVVVVAVGGVFTATHAASTHSSGVGVGSGRSDGPIVFVRHTPGPDPDLPDAALYETSSVGGSARRLTPIAGLINLVAATPDGSRIAYNTETYVAGKDRHVTGDLVHVMNADGSDSRVVYHCPNSNCSSLQWSPSGDRLLIDGSVIVEPDGHTVPLCGSGSGCSTDELVDASWSPDGHKLVFEDAVTLQLPGGASSQTAIGVANADGSNSHLITDRQCSVDNEAQCTFDTDPVWSPDGDIAFVRMKPDFFRLDDSLGPGESGPTGLYTMTGDGTRVDEVDACRGNTPNAPSASATCEISSIQWAPDGLQIAFVIGSGYSNERDDDLATTSTVILATPASRSISRIRVPTRVPQSDQHWTEPVVSWSPTGNDLAMAVDGYHGHSGVFRLPVRGTTIGSPALLTNGGYPPETWLPGGP
jgi:Tol biopolymer transport system component